MSQEEDLIQKLAENGFLGTGLPDLVKEAKDKGISLPEYLIKNGLASKTQVYETLASIYGVPYVEVSNFQISPEVLNSVPADLANRYRLIPLFKIGNSLNIAMENPMDVTAIDHVVQKSHMEVEVCLGAKEDIQTALVEHYGSGNSMSRILENLNQERMGSHRSKSPTALSDLFQEGEKRPIIQLVNSMLIQAYEQGVSDIHIEPEEKMLRIRYRVDGVLQQASTPPKELESEILSRVKILAQMDIAETRVAQDGRIKLQINDKEANMRVSSVPTVYGENIVIRILRDESAVLDLTALGFDKEMKEIFEELIRRPYGMILETGPTGSGKTTTLYAALRCINSVERNIVTIEDPVEYKLPFLRQIPVNPKAGLTFANSLRSILRQDPDVIMVGEIRDIETAEIAIQAAMTGHLVFSTLHTNNAASVMTRLIDMEIKPFLVAASVIGVVSQRLVRRVCEKCREETRLTPLELKALKLTDPNSKAFKGKGCRHCHKTGYKGRIGLYEILKINREIQKIIMANASTSEIEQEGLKSGCLKGMREDALKKLEAGVTTAEEILKTVDLG